MKLNQQQMALLDALKNKGDAGMSILESGVEAATFNSRIKAIRDHKYRVDFQNDRYYFKGEGDFSLSMRPGQKKERKIWAKGKDPEKQAQRKPRQKRQKKIAPPLPGSETSKPKVQEQEPIKLFIINMDEVARSMQGAPKAFRDLVDQTLKMTCKCQDAYEALMALKTSEKKLQTLLQ